MTKDLTFCRHCKKIIINPKINQSYHESCFILHRRIYKRKKEKKYYSDRIKEFKDKICKSCGESFQATHGNQKYCSVICKKDYKSKLKGFRSHEEEIAFKDKSCPNCFCDLIYNHYTDTFECILCGYKRRPLTPVSEDSYTRIKFFKLDTDSPFDRNFQKIRGSPQMQSLKTNEESISIATGVVLPENLFCDACGMLNSRCSCN